MKSDRQLAMESAARASFAARASLVTPWLSQPGHDLPVNHLLTARPETRGNARAQLDEIQTVVVPLDGTLYAEHALPHALAIVRQTGATLRLLRVYSHLDDIEPWQFSRAADGVKRSKYEKRDYLARLARQIGRISGMEPETVLIDTPDTLDALADGAADADLVVVGSRRRRLMAPLWWNNRVDQLRRRLTAPLLLTAGQAGPVDLTVHPRFRHILVPLDGTMQGQAVLKSAAQLSRASEGSLTLLNVQNESWTLGSFEHTSPRSYLLSTIQQLAKSGTRAEAEVIATSRSPAQAIASFADTHEVDLIAIATQGDSGLARLMRGSLADTLQRNAKVPILLKNVPAPVRRPEVVSIG